MVAAQIDLARQPSGSETLDKSPGLQRVPGLLRRDTHADRRQPAGLFLDRDLDAAVGAAGAGGRGCAGDRGPDGLRRRLSLGQGVASY